MVIRRKHPDEPVRSVIYLDDFGLFFLGGKGKDDVQVEELVFEQVSAQHPARTLRTVVVRGDSRYGVGNAFTQRVWLALLVIFERCGRPADGLIEFTIFEVLEILGLQSTGGQSYLDVHVALHRLDATRIYVTGKALDGPAADTTRTVGARAEHKYALLSDDGHTANAEAEQAEQQLLGDLRMVADGGEVLADERSQLEDARARGRRLRRSEHITRRRLGRYVTACLVGTHGRLVPPEVFRLRSGYAIRLMCLLGTRANGKRELRISRDRLTVAIPCVDTKGDPLRPATAVRSIVRACGELMDVGFLSSFDYDHESTMFDFRFPASGTGAKRAPSPPPTSPGAIDITEVERREIERAKKRLGA